MILGFINLFSAGCCCGTVMFYEDSDFKLNALSTLIGIANLGIGVNYTLKQDLAKL